MSARIAYLIRHGRTELNAAGCLRGHADPPLDDIGRTEAERLGKLFVGVRADEILVSPLTRARQTAAPLAETIGVETLTVFRFADRDYGQWNGAAVPEVARTFGSVDAAPGVEPRERFEKRVLDAFATGCKRAAGAFIVVAHERVNQVILAALVPSLGRDSERIPQRTGCWNLLERSGSAWTAPIVDAVPQDGRQP